MKSISKLFDSKKINNCQHINGGANGSMGSTTQTDTGLTSSGTYDVETTNKAGGCDSSHTGFAGGNGEKDNPVNPIETR
jgi:hypothetical protein